MSSYSMMSCAILSCRSFHTGLSIFSLIPYVKLLLNMPRHIFTFEAVASKHTEYLPLSFQCNLKCTRCKGLTGADKQQCTRTSCIGTPYCPDHMHSTLSLCIRPSTIPDAGQGVFACSRNSRRGKHVFHKGQIVCDYGGEVVSEAELTRRYGNLTAPYGLAGVTKGYFEDAACLRGIGSMINHNAERANVEYLHDLGQNKLVIRATKHIRDGEELFIDYGPDYVCNERGVTHSTILDENVNDDKNTRPARSSVYIVGPLEALLPARP